MLHEFLAANRQELIKRCKANMALRFAPSLDTGVVENGVPVFLGQLENILRDEQSRPRPAETRHLHAVPVPASTSIGRSAALHGRELLRHGFNVDQVVHGYGDVCQAITGLAVEQKAPISTDEFRTLNRCLDNAIADAVTAFAAGNAKSVKTQVDTTLARLESFGDEQRRLVDIAINSYAAMKTGNIGLSGATGALLAHALDELRSLPERVQSDFRLADAASARR